MTDSGEQNPKGENRLNRADSDQPKAQLSDQADTSREDLRELRESLKESATEHSKWLKEFKQQLARSEAARLEWSEEFKQKMAESEAARLEWSKEFKQQLARSEAARLEWSEEFKQQLARSEAARLEWSKEFRQKMAESEAARLEWSKEFRQKMAESEAARLEWSKESAESGKEFDRKLDKIAKQFGGFTNNYGEALEQEFLSAVSAEMLIGDIELLKLVPNLRLSHYSYEYDMVGINGDYVVVGEIKVKFLPEQVLEFAEKSLPRFEADFPEFATNRKVLGMIGGETITDDAVKEARRLGFIILRLRNKKLVAENVDGARRKN